MNRTVYICERGDGTMSAIHHETAEEANAWGKMARKHDRCEWKVIEFVEVEVPDGD